MAIPALMMALLFPVIGVAAVFLLLRGHDLPGGGFVAGVTMAVAFILQYMARGTIWVEARLRVLPVRWMGVGLLLAGGTGCRRVAVRPALPDLVLLLRRDSVDRRRSAGERAPLRSRRVRSRRRRDRADADRDRASVGAKPPRAARPRARRACRAASNGGGGMMEIVLALGIGALAGSGVWLILRPRTFQVIIGLSLLSYAVNLFIVAMGRLRTGAAPILAAREARRSLRSTPIRCRRRSS